MTPHPPRPVCARCRRPSAVCYCAHLLSLPTRTRVVFLQHPREAKAISVGEMAKVVAMEERTFQRRFKAATGMKPIEYAQHLRMGKARELLEFTRRTVEQIAWAVGYEDAAAFRKLFHRIVGLSPGGDRALA